MTASSLGRFFRGVAIPSDFGSIFTTAVDMAKIIHNLSRTGLPACPPEAKLILQLVAQRDIRLVQLRHWTARLGILYRLLEGFFARARHLGGQFQVALRNSESVGQFL